ncbi:hypothetical protein GE061_007789 [Apolygus lucorum]|uniref:Uncharacterized protein n=1 Tax=Apolygus lucorum TaxID=248454 RepID=A0A8S9WMS3_APOLU|nr:hypothetical protein GE061_007789 [Apolygus lucorum]
MGDWGLHLECVKEMIPFFHAAGHFNYAKSTHLYYQDMQNLRAKMTSDEFHKFTTQGNFTIRRSDKFWSGIWSDMTIEQVLMRAMKTYGGLTHGRGITDSVLSRWTVEMLCLQQICEQVELYTEVRSGTSEQHVDMRPSRVTRDNADVKKLKVWLSEHDPFQDNKELMSLSTGQIASDQVNCHTARDIGIACMKKVEGQTFDCIKLKRKDKVTTLASTASTAKIGKKKVTIDPLTLFQRVCLAKQSDKDLEDLFTYELSPYPISLFSEEGMRKGKKSALYDAAFTPIEREVNFGREATEEHADQDYGATTVGDGPPLQGRVGNLENQPDRTPGNSYSHQVLTHHSSTLSTDLECPTGSPLCERCLQTAWDRIRQGRQRVENEPHDRRPRTSKTQENINEIRRLIEGDRHFTVREISEELGISFGSVQSIIKTDLGFTKIAARWVPRLLSDEQKNERVRISQLLLQRFQEEGTDFLHKIVTCDETWVHHYTPSNKRSSEEWRKKGEMAPVKAKARLSAGKVLATVFWDCRGVLLIDFLHERRTINAEYYCGLLHQVRQAYRTKRRDCPIREVLLLHDNARPHTAALTREKLEEMHWTTVEHPPYSPDLSPCDYHMFGPLKEALGGERFQTDEEVETFVCNWLRTRPSTFFKTGIEKLPNRWEKCITLEGDYVEK